MADLGTHSAWRIGTAAERGVFSTTGLRIPFFWYETDTLDLWCWDGSWRHLIGSGDRTSGNYVGFASDGEITLYGTARVWRCVDLTPTNVGKPSANPPATDEYQGFSFDRYDRGTEEQVYFAWHIPSDFAVGDASVRGHFGFFVENPPAVGNEVVVLGFEYKKIDADTPDVFDFSGGTTSGTISTTITAGESAYLWHETATGNCTTTGWTHGDLVLFRFYRDATNPDDTYDNEVSATDNDVWVGQYHLEYLCDTLGEAS